jgi:hypothetical protein
MPAWVVSFCSDNPSRTRSKMALSTGEIHVSKDTIRESIDFWIGQHQPEVRRFSPHDLRSTTNPSTRTSPCVKRIFGFPLGKLAVWYFAVASSGRAPVRMWCDREQTAHLQTALWHLAVRTQIRTAQPGSIRSTGLGAIAAA